MRLLQFLFLTLLIFLAACQPATEAPAATGAALPGTPTPTQPPTITPVPTVPPEIYQNQCLQVLPALPVDVNLAGRVILAAQQPCYYDFRERTLQTMPDNRVALGVSPDRRWLAYIERSDDSPTGLWLVLEDIEGQRTPLAFQDDWIFLDPIIWLDNHRLIYNLAGGNPSGIYPIVIIDPFTGDTQELASDYPNLAGAGGWMQFVYSSVVYEPSLDLVIYPETAGGSYFVTLWNRRTQEPVVRLERGPWVDQHAPLWFPDGSQFVVAARQRNQNNDEWFMVSREGEIRQLTNLGNFSESVNIGLGQISPDGQHLAFWLGFDPVAYTDQKLAILDIETQQVTNYCIPGSIHGDAAPPVWSADSRYIVVENYYAINRRHVILVDTIDNWAAQIAEDFTPVGWMLAP